jgi:tryptophan-rich sensory protein
MVKYNARWYAKLKKAPLNPPNWVFGTVWPILYIMLALSYTIVAKDPRCNMYCKYMNPFVIQIFLNLTWTTLFFKYKQIHLAFVSILAILYFSYQSYKGFYEISPLASYLLVPYMLWLCFAAYLNGFIILNN